MHPLSRVPHLAVTCPSFGRHVSLADSTRITNSGEKYPSVRILFEMAELLDVRVQDFFVDV